jgi:hypothetical protein
MAIAPGVGGFHMSKPRAKLGRNRVVRKTLPCWQPTGVFARAFGAMFWKRPPGVIWNNLGLAFREPLRGL